MKKYILLILALVMSMTVLSLAQTEPGKSIASKTIESLSQGKVELTIPRVGSGVDRIVLDNGLVLFFYEDHKLPLFNITAMIRCGSIYDPLEKNGLSGLVGTVMRSGGSKSINGDSLNNLLEFAGASLETSIGTESGYASLSVLSKDTDLGLKVMADLLRNPAFPQDKLDLAKTRSQESDQASQRQSESTGRFLLLQYRIR